jgi:glutathione S-transferase
MIHSCAGSSDAIPGGNTMKLYNANLSPNALRVRAVVFELGLDVEIVDVDLRSGENRTAEYLALNPNGKVPTLVDGDFVVWESRAIDAYLASKKPEKNLYPQDPKTRAIIDQWSYWNAIHLSSAIQPIVYEKLVKKLFGRGDPDESIVETKMKALGQLLPVLDTGLKDKEWLAGTLSIADFAMASVFVFRDPLGLHLNETPNVASWIGRMDALPSWQKAVAPINAFMNR